MAVATAGPSARNAANNANRQANTNAGRAGATSAAGGAAGAGANAILNAVAGAGTYADGRNAVSPDTGKEAAGLKPGGGQADQGQTTAQDAGAQVGVAGAGGGGGSNGGEVSNPQRSMLAQTPTGDAAGGKPDYLQMFNHLAKWEGGLSRDASDAASKHPCPDPYNGQYGWHTNKGVTWETFQSAAPLLGYSKTDSKKFFAMTDDLVKKIFKAKYWDAVKGDEYNSQVVANIFSQWAWGSGVTGSLRVLKGVVEVNSWDEAPAKINDLIAKDGERAVFEALMQHRRDYLISISKPGSDNNKFQKGWLRRHDEFYELNSKLVDGGQAPQMGG